MSFEEIFAALKPVLTPYAARLSVRDNPGEYYLETKTAVYKKRPMMFAAVRTGKAYASFHLMPIYMCPLLQASLSDGLRARMQGKACFNFRAVEPDQIEELTRLTERAFQRFKDGGFI